MVSTPLSEPQSLLGILETAPLFKGLSAEQLGSLAAGAQIRRFAKDELLLREGSQDKQLLLLMDGTAQLRKTMAAPAERIVLNELHAGDVLGELTLVEPGQEHHESAIALTPVTAAALDPDALLDASAGTRAIILANVGRLLAQRLRQRSHESAAAILCEREESRTRAYAGSFILNMFVLLGFTGMVVTGVPMLPQPLRPPPAILSLLLIVATLIPIANSLRRAPFTLASYGLTLRDGWSKARQALVWSIPGLVFFALVKLALMRWLPSMAHRPFFDPGALFSGRPFDGRLFAVMVVVYMLHSPMQEFVARAGFQGNIDRFIPAAPGRTNWWAIFLASHLFASLHCYLGFWYGVAAFFPSLLWGWMYDKQRSLIGVSVSHIVIGLWALFALGIQAAVGGG